MSLSYVFPIIFCLHIFFQCFIYILFKKNDSIFKFILNLFFFISSIIFSFVAYLSSNPDRMIDIDYQVMVQAMAGSRSEGISYLTGYRYGSHPMSAVLLYLIGLTGNYALLKLISAFVFFACLWFLSYKLIEIGFNRWSTLFGWMVVVASNDFSESFTNNVRFPLAAVICLTAIINIELFSGSKLINYIIILFSGLLHASIWMYVLFYSITFLTRRFKRNAIFVSFLIPLLTYPILYVLNYPLNVLIPSLGGKISLYLFPEYDMNFVSNKQNLYYELCLLMGLFFLLIFHFSFLRSNIDIFNTKINNYNLQIVFTSALGIGMMFVTPLFIRYGAKELFVSFPLIVLLLNNFFPDKTSFGVRLSMKASIKDLFYYLFIVLLIFSFGSLFFRCISAYSHILINF